MAATASAPTVIAGPVTPGSAPRSAPAAAITAGSDGQGGDLQRQPDQRVRRGGAQAVRRGGVRGAGERARTGPQPADPPYRADRDHERRDRRRG